MTQYIRTHCDVDPEFWPEVSQHFQISRLSTVIEVDWHNASQRVVVHINGEHFFLTSPDRQNITLRDVLYALQYASERIVLDYSDLEWSLDNTLDTPVRDAPLSQFTIYPNNDPATTTTTAAGSPAPTEVVSLWATLPSSASQSEVLDIPIQPHVLMRRNANFFC